jgi:hypothetical protein
MQPKANILAARCSMQCQNQPWQQQTFRHRKPGTTEHLRANKPRCMEPKNIRQCYSRLFAHSSTAPVGCAAHCGSNKMQHVDTLWVKTEDCKPKRHKGPTPESHLCLCSAECCCTSLFADDTRHTWYTEAATLHGMGLLLCSA